MKDLKFPAIDELGGLPSANLIGSGINGRSFPNTKERTSEEWTSSVMERQWGLIEDLEGIGTPDTLWWHFLRDRVREVIWDKYEKSRKPDYRTSRGVREDKDPLPQEEYFEELILAVSKECWEFFWKCQATDKIDMTFQTIEQFGYPWLTEEDRIRLRGIRGGLREAIGAEHKPSKGLISFGDSQKVELLRSLCQGIEPAFNRFDVNVKDFEFRPIPLPVVPYGPVRRLHKPFNNCSNRAIPLTVFRPLGFHGKGWQYHGGAGQEGLLIFRMSPQFNGDRHWPQTVVPEAQPK